MFCGSGGSKSRFAKVADAEPSGQMRYQKVQPLWHEAHFEVKMLQTLDVRGNFGSGEVGKVQAAGVRSTNRSQNVKTCSNTALLEVKMFKKCTALTRNGQNTSSSSSSSCSSEHFWKLSCSKSARHCGAKHISKSQKNEMLEPLLEIRMLKKCTPLWREAHFQVKKHEMLEPLLEVQILKKCIPLWREAHCQVKMVKEPYVRTAFGGLDVEKVHAVAARNTLPSKHGKTTTRLDHFWTLKRRFVWRKGFCTLPKMQKKTCGACGRFRKRWQARSI